MRAALTIYEGERAREGEANFLAIRVSTTANLGAYVANLGPVSPSLLYTRMLANAYRTPAIYAEVRSEEHTSELQSQPYLVSRLLLEKKKNTIPLNLHTPHQHANQHEVQEEPQQNLGE